MILLDSSALISAVVRNQMDHASCHRALQNTEPPLVLSPFVLAEVDYLIQKYGGTTLEREFLNEVADGVYELAPFSAADVRLASEVVSRYSDLEIGLADASIVVLAARHNCWDVLTLDERHFRALRVPGSRRAFRILPADL